MKKMLAAFVLRSFNRRHRGKIIIEPDPHHIRAVFERAGQPAPADHTPWLWPKKTWLRKRLVYRQQMERFDKLAK